MWYDFSMKVTISIPENTFEAAEKMAGDLGLTRSALYVQAIEKMLKEIENRAITEQLNKVYAKVDSSLDSVMRDQASHTLERTEW